MHMVDQRAEFLPFLWFGCVSGSHGGSKRPKWGHQVGAPKHKTRKRKLFGPGCLEAPKDEDQGYPELPKGPKWENPSIKRGSGSFSVLVA